MLTGEYPFKGKNKEEVFENIRNYSLLEDLNHNSLPSECIDLIKKFLKLDPNKRIKLN